MFITIIYIILAGIAFPIGGATMKKLWNDNALADVYSVGLGSAACMGAALFASQGWSIQLGAAIACLLCTVLTTFVQAWTNTERFITFGMLFGSFLGALGTIAANNATPENLQSYYRWAGASFDVSGTDPLLLVISILLFVLGSLFVYNMWRNRAAAVIGYFGVSLMITSVIMVCGLVSMISIVIPNIVNLVAKHRSSHYKLCVGCILSIVVLSITYAITRLTDTIYLPISATLQLVLTPFIILTLRKSV